MIRGAGRRVANDAVTTTTEAAQTERRIGEMLAGRYRLKGLLGSGGMGDVFAAESLVLQREVALKVLRSEHAREKRSVARFLREARAAAKVSHPHVVHILDAGIDQSGIPFIAQELLSGEDLGTYLDRHGGKLGVEHALEIMRPVIDAMAVAHALGVVHRDLKPENIFLARDDEGRVVPKVLDFGISKIVDEATLEDRTQTGVIIGTPHYMAPEQIIGSRELDGRVDVWALGVILFELMTGEIPFGSRDDARIFMRIAIAEARPLDSLVPSASKDLARIVQRCLRRNIGERYPSAAELARDLKNLKESVPIEATQKLAIVAHEHTPLAIDPLDRAAAAHRAAQATVESSVAEALARLDVDPDAPPSERPAAPTAVLAPPSTPASSTIVATTQAEIARPGLVVAALAFLLAALVVAASAMRTGGAAHGEQAVETAPH
jgi:serine/threonine-protein kinase